MGARPHPSRGHTRYDPAVEITLGEQVKCLQREVNWRFRMYPKWVIAGRMTQNDADFQIAAMRAALKTLQSFQKPDLFKEGPEQ